MPSRMTGYCEYCCGLCYNFGRRNCCMDYMLNLFSAFLLDIPDIFDLSVYIDWGLEEMLLAIFMLLLVDLRMVVYWPKHVVLSIFVLNTLDNVLCLRSIIYANFKPFKQSVRSNCGSLNIKQTFFIYFFILYYDQQCTVISQITYRASTTVESTFTLYIQPPHRLTSWEL